MTMICDMSRRSDSRTARKGSVAEKKGCVLEQESSLPFRVVSSSLSSNHRSHRHDDHVRIVLLPTVSIPLAASQRILAAISLPITCRVPTRATFIAATAQRVCGQLNTNTTTNNITNKKNHNTENNNKEENNNNVEPGALDAPAARPAFCSRSHPSTDFAAHQYSSEASSSSDACAPGARFFCCNSICLIKMMMTHRDHHHPLSHGR